MRHVYVDLPGTGDSLGAPCRMLSPAGAGPVSIDAAISPCSISQTDSGKRRSVSRTHHVCVRLARSISSPPMPGGGVAPNSRQHVREIERASIVHVHNSGLRIGYISGNSLASGLFGHYVLYMGFIHCMVRCFRGSRKAEVFGPNVYSRVCGCKATTSQSATGRLLSATYNLRLCKPHLLLSFAGDLN
jgi:hypothetical protein